MFKRKPHPGQLVLLSDKDAELERMIEARVALRAEADAVRWRFRLIVLETIMMAVLIAAAGVALDQKPVLVFRAALLVGATCFASGVLLIGLSGASGWLLSRLRRWRAQ